MFLLKHLLTFLHIIPIRTQELIGNEKQDIPGCPGYEETVAVFSDGSRVPLAETVMLNDDEETQITVLPRLNCLEQDSPFLVQFVKDNLLVKPESTPYRLEDIDSLRADGQPNVIDQRYFYEKKKGGFFIEAGAYDGAHDSTTLHFEMKHQWSGLLVEPVPRYFKKIAGRGRRTWSVMTCLSRKTRPETVRFNVDGKEETTMQGKVFPECTNKGIF